MKLLHVALSLLSFSTLSLASTPQNPRQEAFSEDLLQATKNLGAETQKLLNVVENNNNFTSSIDEVKVLKKSTTSFLITQEIGEATTQDLNDAFDTVSVAYAQVSRSIRISLFRHPSHDVLYHQIKVRNAYLKLNALQYGDDLDD